MDYIQYFEEKTRQNDTKFWCLDDAAPEELQELVYNVHKELFDAFPDDWVYTQIVNAFQDLEEQSIDDCYIEPDCYYHDLYEWVHKCWARALCDEAVSEGFADGTDIDKTVQAGNFLGKEKIYRFVADWLEERERQEDESE